MNVYALTMPAEGAPFYQCDPGAEGTPLPPWFLRIHPTPIMFPRIHLFLMPLLLLHLWPMFNNSTSTQPSLVTSKKTDEYEEMVAQSTSLKCKNPPRFVDFKISSINWRGFDPQH